MSELVIYNDLKTALEGITWTEVIGGVSTTQRLKLVDKWRNQFESKKVQPNACPCVYIQISRSNFVNLLMGVQQYDLDITLHIGFESYKDTDTEIITLKQTIDRTVHRLQPDTTCSMLLRTGEVQEDFHDQVQDYQQSFKSTMKDFNHDEGLVPATVDLVLDMAIDPPADLPLLLLEDGTNILTEAGEELALN